LDEFERRASALGGVLKSRRKIAGIITRGGKSGPWGGKRGQKRAAYVV